MKTLLDNFINSYQNELANLIKKIDYKKLSLIVEKIYECCIKEQTIFVIGNGGSASTSSHIVCDLSNIDIKAISLNTNLSVITAISNDQDYKMIFKEQMKNVVKEDDILIVFSASGNSLNIIEAINYAKEKGLVVIGFLGFDGGRALELVDSYILVESYNYGIVEDVHMMLSHMLAQYLGKKMYKGRKQ